MVLHNLNIRIICFFTLQYIHFIIRRTFPSKFCFYWHRMWFIWSKNTVILLFNTIPSYFLNFPSVSFNKVSSLNRQRLGLCLYHWQHCNNACYCLIWNKERFTVIFFNIISLYVHLIHSATKTKINIKIKFVCQLFKNQVNNFAIRNLF